MSLVTLTLNMHIIASADDMVSRPFVCGRVMREQAVGCMIQDDESCGCLDAKGGGAIKTQTSVQLSEKLRFQRKVFKGQSSPYLGTSLLCLAALDCVCRTLVGNKLAFLSRTI